MNNGNGFGKLYADFGKNGIVMVETVKGETNHLQRLSYNLRGLDRDCASTAEPARIVDEIKVSNSKYVNCRVVVQLSCEFSKVKMDEEYGKLNHRYVPNPIIESDYAASWTGDKQEIDTGRGLDGLGFYGSNWFVGVYDYIGNQIMCEPLKPRLPYPIDLSGNNTDLISVMDVVIPNKNSYAKYPYYYHQAEASNFRAFSFEEVLDDVVDYNEQTSIYLRIEN